MIYTTQFLTALKMFTVCKSHKLTVIDSQGISCKRQSLSFVSIVTLSQEMTVQLKPLVIVWSIVKVFDIPQGSAMIVIF